MSSGPYQTSKKHSVKKPPPQWPPLRRRHPALRTMDSIGRLCGRIAKTIVIVGGISGIAYLVYLSRNSPPKTSSIYTPQLPESVLPGKNWLWSRPENAPNGTEWPNDSGYIAGYPRLNVFGQAAVVVDNTGGYNDLFGKLIDRDQQPMAAVRVFFLKAKSSLELKSVKPGHYDIRYMNLDSGRIRQSNIIEVTLKKTPKGEEYMGWTVGLYDVVNGTTFHTDITERNF